jgi:hypothetical protein
MRESTDWGEGIGHKQKEKRIKRRGEEGMKSRRR